MFAFGVAIFHSECENVYFVRLCLVKAPRAGYVRFEGVTDFPIRGVSRITSVTN